MAPRTVYANLADGLNPLSLWDASLADMGNLGVIPCTAAGTNTIVLTPIAAAFTPNISTPPQQLQHFSFVAVATSTGPVTVNGLKLYKEDGTTQASTNDILNTVLYGVVYNSALNGAAGGYQIAFPITSILNPVISGATISSSTISGSTITTSTYNGNTWTAGTGTLTIAAGKTLTASNSLILAGTDGTTLTFPSTSATIARTDAGQTFTGTNAFGVLTATTINGNTFTAGTYTLTGTAGKTLTFSNSLTLAGTDSTTITFQATDTYVGRATTDTLTNKTFDTAGTGNVFKINGVTISANTGTGSNVLATSPALVTPTLGVATATTVAFSPTTGGIVGTATNDNTTAGNVGEYIESDIVIGSAVALTSNTAANVTSISLTAGDWDVSGAVVFSPSAGTTQSAFFGAVNTVSATLPTAPNKGAMTGFNLTTAATVSQICSFGSRRYSFSTTTTVFLIAFSTFAVSTNSAYGIIRARRVR